MILEASKIDYKNIKGKQLKPRASMAMYTKDPNMNENMRLLELCRNYWESLSDFRNRYRRNRRYNRGDQWGDKIQDPKTGKWITEDEYIRQQGKVPLKQNLYRMILKNLLGQYRNNSSKPLVISRTIDDKDSSTMLTNAVHHVHQLNYIKELDARMLEVFAMGGIALGKVNYRYFKTRNEEDVYFRNGSIHRLFFNSDIQDPRGDDLRLIGEIIDCDIDDVISSFAKTPQDEKRLRELYKYVNRDNFVTYTGLNSRTLDNLSFYIPEDSTKARIVEIWQLKSEWRTKVHDWADGSHTTTDYTMAEIEAINQQRKAFGLAQGASEEDIPLLEAEPIKEQFWYVKYLTPFGETLYEGETPYKHEEHPYVMTAYPLIDGEVWGFMDDIIDQQRYINRMITLLDFIMSASAKGVLMIPEDSLGDMTVDEFAEEWRTFNGVITYKPSKEHQHIPKQISANSTSVGITEMLQLQMQFINDVSGVHSAIQGKQASAGTPAALYAQEAQNAATNTLDFFHNFAFYTQKRDEKILQLVLQFYKDERYFAIAGERDAAKKFDPKKVNGKYDLVMSKGTDTPAYKMMMDESLSKLLDRQLIDVVTYLENSSMPYASNILESIKNKQQTAAAGAMPTGDIPLGQNPNPQAMAMINQAIGK